jgi:hypothetical protein
MLRLLSSDQVLAHPFVIGEVAVGHLRDRNRILGTLRDLPAAIVAPDEQFWISSTDICWQVVVLVTSTFTCLRLRAWVMPVFGPPINGVGLRRSFCRCQPNYESYLAMKDK